MSPPTYRPLPLRAVRSVSDAAVRRPAAYQALTDDIARRNWELYGNPDGPGVMNFGIALPSWIVQKENSIWVLGVYTLVFMIALPTVVGIWWYNSIKFSGDQVGGWMDGEMAELPSVSMDA